MRLEHLFLANFLALGLALTWAAILAAAGWCALGAAYRRLAEG